MQWEYDVEKEECQGSAAAAVAQSQVTTGRSAALKDAFSKCMRKDGWKMATGKPVVTDPPLEAGKRAPVISHDEEHKKQLAAQQEAQRQAAARQQQQPPLQPGYMQPAPAATSAAPVASQPIPQGASTYQPVQPAADVPLTQTPATVPANTQPGRHF